MSEEKTRLFIEEHINDDTRTLALQAARYPDIDFRYALTQIEGWQTAKEKLPMWASCKGVLYPPRISMEQCSSEITARYKASLAAGNRLADLTGGFGIDFSYMAQKFSHAIYVERNSKLCEIATHNFSLLKQANIEIINDHCENILHTLPQCDCIFVDPARRNDNGGKVVSLELCEPDITQLEQAIMEKSKKAIIKCSPMLDIHAACSKLKNIAQIHIVAVNNECKEVLLILTKEKQIEKELHCINIHGDKTQRFCTTIQQDSSEIRYTCNISNYLYEPNAAIQKAGCHGAIARRWNIEKLHPNSHLYTSDKLIEDFPGRIFTVEAKSSFSKSEIKSLTNGITKANITIRNFPETVQNLRKRLKINEGGDIYLFATTLFDGTRTLIKCKKA